MVNKVGWNVGAKSAEPLYRRDQSDGTFLLDDNDRHILDTDFPNTLAAIRASGAVQHFSWLTNGIETIPSEPGWTIDISEILTESFLTCDPKRLCRKTHQLREMVASTKHFRLGDVLVPVTERTTSTGERITINSSKEYKYVEIGDAEAGSYRWTSLRGWQLPGRAKHLAEPGDLYLGSIWGSVRKWIFIGDDASDIVVTNGFIRTRFIEGKESSLIDLIAGLCTETYTTQMRVFARGSDGLAEISVNDVMDVVLPRVTKKSAREQLEPFANQLKAGFTSAEAMVAVLTRQGKLPSSNLAPRSDHWAIV